MRLFEVKSLGGSNFIRPDRVIALQTSPTGTCVIVMEGGATVQSSEKPSEIAARIQTAGANTAG
jgi:hypothetical protein